MENVSGLSQIDRVRYSYLFIIGLITISAFAVILFGVNGLALSTLVLLGFIITPLLYDKPKIFLFFSLFIYPFTRILPLDDKFIITGGLYALSMPCIFWIIRKRFTSASHTSFYLWAMLGYVLVVLFNYLRPETGIIDLAKEFGRTFFAIFTILAVYDYVESNQNNLHKLTRYLSYALNLMAVITIGQYLTKTGGMFHDGVYRARGMFYNYNECAYVLSLFICFALYVLLTTQKHKLYWVITIGLSLMALMSTFSKTSIINTVLIFFIMSMFLPWKRKLQLFASSVVIGLGVFVYLVSSGTLSGLVARFMDTSSLEWRYEMWNRMYNLILQGNIFIGQGVNASREFLEVLMPLGKSYAPHNVYLETLYNFGLVGLIPFILIFLFILFQGFSIFLNKDIGNNHNKIVGASIIVIAIVTMIQNYVSNAFYDRAGNVIFWAILTLLVCRYKYYKPDIVNLKRWTRN